MEKLIEILVANRSIVRLWVFVFVCLAGPIPMANAAQLQAARITRIIRDVKILPDQAVPRAATVNEDVNAGTALRTGAESRTELTFADLTITRLGANTIFSFNEGTRELGLGSGAMLVQVPRGGAEVKIITAAISVGITGGTALFESKKGLPTKLLMLEGTGRFYPTGHPEQAAILHGGEMAMVTVNGRITQPTKFNAALVYKSSKLITSFPKLPNADLIMAVIEAQQMEVEGSSANPLDSGGDIDKRDLAIAAGMPPAIVAGTSPPTTGGPSKFGPPSVITSPNPYVINSGTQISTDPKITTNAVTDFGKIYRGVAQDGPFLTWLGATPSGFDNASGEPDPTPALPIACFLFSGLQFDGDPTISTGSEGNATLGLASVGGITFTPSATVYQFSGLDRVSILALNGSIDVSGVNFANFGHLLLEARGAGSSLTMASPISNLVSTNLIAENNVQVGAPVTVSEDFDSFAGNSFATTSTVHAHQMNIQSLGSIQINSSAQLLAMLGAAGNGGTIAILATGGNGSVDVGGQVQADQGTVQIRETGVVGVINVNSATLRADIVKIGALGTNGVLNIGSSNALSANTELDLYAGGSNGTLNFLSSVTLTSPTNILAANRINIAVGAVVTIVNGARRNLPADVFTNDPHYFGFGGNGTAANSGTFGGAGAKNPLPLSQAPPFGP